MTRVGFRRASDGSMVLTLHTDDLDVLRSAMTDVAAVVVAPEDRAVADRLYPRAYLDPTEETAEREFQSVAHDDLVRSRAQQFETMAADLGAGTPRGKFTDVVIEAERVEPWLRGLNDARLVLGTILDVRQDDTEGPEPDDPRAPLWGLYDWLGHLETALVDVLLDELGTAGTDDG